MRGFRYLDDVTTLRLDVALCIGCGKCFEVCPHQVFVLEGARAVVYDADACIECGACMKNCPVSAISVDAGVGCAIGIFHEWLQSWKGIKRAGCCGS